jgi:hypothetical protein
VSRTTLQIRQAMAPWCDRTYFTGASTAVGSGTLTDTSADGPRKHFDDYFNQNWLIDASEIDYQITNFVQSTGVFSVRNGTPNAGAYEIHSFPAAWYIDAINRAAGRLYNEVGLGRQIQDFSVVLNSPLYNAGFEEWSSSSDAPGWTAVNLTLARESQGFNTVFESRYAAKMTGTAGQIQVAGAYLSDLLVLRNFSLNSYAWGWSDTVNSLRLGISNGLSVTTGDYHAGDSRWRLLTVAHAAGEFDERVEPHVIHDSASATDYIDDMWIEGGPTLSRMRCPDHYENGPSRMEAYLIQQRDSFVLGRPQDYPGWEYSRAFDAAVDSDIGMLTFKPPLSNYYRMRMFGTASLTPATNGTSILEITDTQSRLLAAQAAFYVLERALARRPSAWAGDYRQRQAIVLEEITNLKRRVQHATATTLKPDL